MAAMFLAAAGAVVDVLDVVPPPIHGITAASLSRRYANRA